jgi:hypothetical protein
MFRPMITIRYSLLVTVCLLTAACTSQQEAQMASTYKAPNACPEGKVRYCDSRSQRRCGCITQTEVKDFMAAF